MSQQKFQMNTGNASLNEDCRIPMAFVANSVVPTTDFRCRKFYQTYELAGIGATPLPQLGTIGDQSGYLPDKALLQAKLKEWINEFEEDQQ